MKENNKKLEILKFIINNKNKSLDEIITVAAKIACGYLRIIVYEYDPSNKLLQTKIVGNKRFHIDLNEQLSESVFKDKKTIIYSNKNNQFGSLPKEFRSKYNTGICIPIPANNKFNGILLALNKNENKPTNEELENLEFSLYYSIKITDNFTEETDKENIIKAGKSILNINQSKLEMNNKEIYLSENEIKILEILFLSRNKIIKQKEIIDYCWPNKNKSSSLLDVNIFRLRKKIREINKGKDIIKTVRNKGYKVT
tara:strand:- start:14754 stop:15518 length:765 start_codon:yes stop_codon:yes gene_type:complete